MLMMRVGAWPSHEGDTQLMLMMRAGPGHRMKGTRS